jgi:hypothetical protein
MPAILLLRFLEPRSGGSPVRVTVRRTRAGGGVLRSTVVAPGEDATVEIQEGNEVTIVEEVILPPTR